MALYVGENSFSQLHKADSMTKAMLESWTTDTNIDKTNNNNKKCIGFNV